MNDQYRLATDLEINHFKELIAPISTKIHENGEIEPTIGKVIHRITWRVTNELGRFGYMPHPVHLLVKMARPATTPCSLTSRQRP